MSNFEEIDQEVIGGRINGANFAPKVRVLARTQDLLLLWVPGSSYWSGLYGNQYSGSSMVVVKRREHGHYAVTVCEGQRLKQSIFADNSEKIDALLGEGFHKLLHTRKTIVVGDNEPFSKYGNEVPLTGHEFGYKHAMAVKAKREELIAQGVTDDLELIMRSQDVQY